MVQEGHLLAVFNSGHRVMKAEGVLKALGLPVLLIPAPRQLQTDCGLALRFSEDVREEIMQILERESLLPAFVSQYMGGEFVTFWVNEANEPLTIL
ncbi:DUF3343 domain-containing protein [Oryzomonas rubra]|uniref:DUF3343 domain-containing protein n=2 Tax=Oryzomonas rubra TaxID=2509454 RepID=A0A5A9XNB7_9BACT|nr:DUF3343 domain-containing protein [Oryzomonas rubra]